MRGWLCLANLSKHKTGFFFLTSELSDEQHLTDIDHSGMKLDN